jgi:transcriptional regulator with XRE-family HTH domain
MRRLMLDMSQTTLGEAIGVSFQQVQKYENGMNRIGASRLLQIAAILQVPAAVFFDGADLTNFMATTDGVALAKAFMQIGNIQLRRRIVDLVEQIEQSHR